MSFEPRKVSATLALLILISLGLGLAPPMASAVELTLRLNDAEARPGDTVALVLRTYAARPIKQGQICLIACLTQSHQGGALPFDALEDAIVFSEHGDALSLTTFESDGQTQTAILEFSSPTGRINWSDGPLAAVFLALSQDTPPGSEIELALDPANTYFIDDAGEPVPLSFRDGELTVLSVDAPLALSAAGDETVPGNVAVLAVETSEAFALASADLAFRYDTAIAVGPPQVSFDHRYGQAALDLDLSTPGLILASLNSPDGSLNGVPGQLLSILLPTSPTVPVGTRSPVTLDPALTSLVDADGRPVSLTLEGDVVVFVEATPMFSDGFESGSLRRWSSHTP